MVGAGHGGAQAAIALRQWGFEGAIAVERKAGLPYDPPSLSNLAGQKPFERMLLRPPALWNARRIEFLLSRSVVDIDAGQRIACLDTGATIQYRSAPHSVTNPPDG